MPVVGFFFGLLSAIVIMLALTFYSFHLREHHPSRYTGFWRFLGSVVQTPTRALATAGGLLFGALVAQGVLLVLHPDEKAGLILYVDAILLFVLFLSISLGISIHRMRRE